MSTCESCKHWCADARAEVSRWRASTARDFTPAEIKANKMEPYTYGSCKFIVADDMVELEIEDGYLLDLNPRYNFGCNQYEVFDDRGNEP